VHTGQVGVIKFTGESSVGAGLRRVEAYTGLLGLKYLNEQVERLHRVAGMLKVAPERVEERVQRLVDSGRELQKLLERQNASKEKEEVTTILTAGPVNEVAGTKMIPIRRDGREVEEMRRLARAVRDQAGSAVVVVGSARNGAANLVAAVSRDLVDRGLSARDLLAEGAALLGGKAGGGPDLATAGGPKGSEIEKAMAVVESKLRSALET
jgi:alanyl-tRNA synthetase